VTYILDIHKHELQFHKEIVILVTAGLLIIHKHELQYAAMLGLTLYHQACLH